MDRQNWNAKVAKGNWVRVLCMARLVRARERNAACVILWKFRNDKIKDVIIFSIFASTCYIDFLNFNNIYQINKMG